MQPSVQVQDHRLAELWNLLYQNINQAVDEFFEVDRGELHPDYQDSQWYQKLSQRLVLRARDQARDQYQQITGGQPSPDFTAGDLMSARKMFDGLCHQRQEAQRRARQRRQHVESHRRFKSWQWRRAIINQVILGAVAVMWLAALAIILNNIWPASQ